MTKKCIICRQTAYYQIKDSADYYCRDCAEENFSDVEMLVTVEEEAQRLKKAIDERLDEDVEEIEKKEENIAPENEKPRKRSKKSKDDSDDKTDDDKIED